jgi:hypothetical protein
MKDRIRKHLEKDMTPEAHAAFERLTKSSPYTIHCIKLKYMIEAVAKAEFLADDIKGEIVSHQFDLLRRITEIDFLRRILTSMAGIRDDKLMEGLSGEEGLAMTALALIAWRDAMEAKASTLEDKCIALTCEHLADLFPEVAQELTK